jgi:hypothetical protein
MENSHQVSLEEGFQLPFGGRVREVTDVKSATLCSAGQHCLIVSSIGGFVGRGISRFVIEGSVAKSGSNVVDGVRNFLHDGRHGLNGVWWWVN